MGPSLTPMRLWHPFSADSTDVLSPADLPKPRRFLSADGLIETLRRRFDDVPDHRKSNNVRFSMTDTLTAALAMFALKDPSLLAFNDRDDKPNLQNLYQLGGIPSDTAMRQILVGIDVEHLHEAFADIFDELQRGNVLKQFVFHEGHYLLAIDGTGTFCSSKVHCQACLEHKGRDGKTKYVHQAVAAVLVHPDQKCVIPLAVEPIVKQDGQTKNDCERNATGRLLRRIRRLHPRLKLIVVEDGLASNGPHIDDLRELKMHYLLAAKPGDHQHLFDQVIAASDQGRDDYVDRYDAKDPAVLASQTQYVAGVSLNASRRDLQVNFLQHFEFDRASGETTRRFSWVSELELPRQAYLKFVAGGRSRWRIENETFNTLKNQGYHLEHNYGHGKKNLATVLLLLTFLAFLVDQVQQLCCPLFAAVLSKLKRLRSVWDYLRSVIRHFVFGSFAELWRAILAGSLIGRAPPVRV